MSGEGFPTALLKIPECVQSSAVCLPSPSRQQQRTSLFSHGADPAVAPLNMQHPDSHLGHHEKPANPTPFLPLVQRKLKIQAKDSNRKLKQKPNLPKELVIYPLEV